MGRLSGKTALITGGARGIGAAFARAFLREGAQVMVADLTELAVAQAAADMGMLGVQMDVTRQDSIDAGIAHAVERMGGLDILVNNAGVYDLAPIMDITRDSYDKLFAVNVAGTLFTLQAAARQMLAQGRGGRIINLASRPVGGASLWARSIAPPRPPSSA